MNRPPPQSLQARTPKVSVIVPCRNEANHIEHCVSGLLALEAPVGGFEVVVADGMSNDGTREILARLEQQVCGQRSQDNYPLIRVIDNPRRMTPCGLNTAIQAAHGEIIVRADAHTRYAADYLLRCLETLQQAGADNVGGPARTEAEGYCQCAIAAAYHSPFSVGGARFHNLEYEGWVDTVTYGCWRREAFNRFGLFDEELVRNQDDEHNLRIIRGGGKIWQSPKIRSWYRPRGTLPSLFKQYMQYGYWKVRVIQKHRLPASWRHLVPGAFVLTLLGLVLLSALSSLLDAFGFIGIPEFVHFGFELSTYGLLGICSAYFVAILAASVATASGVEWKLLPALPAVFACYHFGYGCGFLLGVWDFVIRRQRANVALQTLTR